MLAMLSWHSKGCLFPKGRGIEQDKKASRARASPAMALSHHPKQGKLSRPRDDNQVEARVQIIRQDGGDEADPRSSQKHESTDQVQVWRQPQSSDRWASLSIITRQVRGQARKTGWKSAYGLSRYGHDGAAGRSTYSIPQAGTEPMGRGCGWKPQGRLLRAFKT